jgi:hypothetical protein
VKEEKEEDRFFKQLKGKYKKNSPGYINQKKKKKRKKG